MTQQIYTPNLYMDTGYKGITWNKWAQKFKVRIGGTSMGQYYTLKEAVKVGYPLEYHPDISHPYDRKRPPGK